MLHRKILLLHVIFTCCFSLSLQAQDLLYFYTESGFDPSIDGWETEFESGYYRNDNSFPVRATFYSEEGEIQNGSNPFIWDYLEEEILMQPGDVVNYSETRWTLGLDQLWEVNNDLISAIALPVTFRLTTLDTVGGNVSDGGTYPAGTLATVTATPNQYYRFTGWSGDLSGTINPQTVLMDRDKSITANFARITYTLTLNDGPGGSTTGGGIYDINTGAQIRAIPDSGYKFSSWSGDFSGTSILSTVLMNRDKTTTANFVRIRYSLFANVGPGGGGRVTGTGVYFAGTTAEATATPFPGYQFIGWRGALSSSLLSDTVLIDRNKTVIADFARITFTLNVSAGLGGTATGSGTYNSGSSATVRATPNNGYRFTGWGGDLSGSMLIDGVLMDRNKTVTANFSRITYTLNVTSGSGGSATGSGTYNSGASATVRATPSNGYRFTGWGGDLSGSMLIDGVLMDRNKTVTANFSRITYTLNVTAESGGSATGSGIYNSGSSATVRATPSNGYRFTGWGGDLSSSLLSNALLMDRNKTVTANFSRITYTLNVTAGSGGSVTGSGTYNSGASATVRATPSNGYRFTGWIGDASGSVNPLGVLMSANKNINASFEQIVYTLTTQAGSGGTVTPGGSYPVNVNVLVQANPLPGYRFTQWTGDSKSSNRSVNILMDENKTLTAVFAAKLDQTINFDDPGDRDFDADPFDLSVWATSGLPVKLTLKKGDVELNGQTVTINGSDPVLIQADQPGNNLYNPAPTANISFEIAQPSSMKLTTQNTGINLLHSQQRKGSSSFMLTD